MYEYTHHKIADGEHGYVYERLSPFGRLVAYVTVTNEDEWGEDWKLFAACDSGKRAAMKLAAA